MTTWNTAERRSLENMKVASDRVAAKAISNGPRGKALICNGPYVLHDDGRVVCTGQCQHGKIWERLPFLGWNHLKAKKAQCAPSSTAGATCERCAA